MSRMLLIGVFCLVGSPFSPGNGQEPPFFFDDFEAGEVCSWTAAQPMPIEICDLLDNDCDGFPDDGNPVDGVSCETGFLGVCAAGLTDCSGPALVCEQLVPATAEICDDLDNDCDGTPDDGNPGGGASCNTGIPGVCAAGTTDCVNGSLACLQDVLPSPEICDDLDNDCDGTPDDGNPGGGGACNTGLPGVCAAGTTNCVAGAFSCLQDVPSSPEVCDALDNDCDGTSDEAFDCVIGASRQCGTNIGECNYGVQTCDVACQWASCVGSVEPQPEVCDGLDNDCDGQVDEGVCA